MLARRKVLRGGALLLPVVMLVFGLSGPVLDVDVFPAPPATISPHQGATLIFLMPLAIVLAGIAAFVAILWRKARKPLLPHEEFIALLQREEWGRK